MEIHALLAQGKERLAGLGEGRLISRLLLQELLEVSTAYLLAHGDDDVSPEIAGRYHAWLGRAEAAEPLPYIVGKAPFYDRRFQVTPDVLIPRPETEGLVDLALAWASEARPRHIFDVGTGSGCIAIILAERLKGYTWGVDISQAALRIARQNIARLLPAGRVELVAGDLLTSFSSSWSWEGAWLIVANLPYVTDLEWTELAVGVKSYEPALALKAGADGFILIDRLLAQVAAIAEHTSYPGALFLEIGWRQGAAGLDLMRRYLPAARLSLQQDLAGLDRYLTAILPGR